MSAVTTGATDTSPTTRYAHNVLGQRVFKTEPLYPPVEGDESDKGFMQSLVAFFTKLWGPSANDAEKQGFAFMYDEEGTLLSETGTGGANSTGSTQYIYLPTANGPMPVAAVINGSLYAVHSDHLNTPRRLTNSQGQPVWQWAYSAFGDEKPTIAKYRFANLEVNPNPGTTSFAEFVMNLRWPGQYYDKESGLFYNYFRSLDPRTGRYTQFDPIGLRGGWNGFGYVNANPLSFADPLGLDSTDYLNTYGGRSLLNGPSNGNWGGKCWSGGQHSCKGNPVGNAPPTDSGDACYQRHDLCYVSCGSNGACRAACDKKMVDELKALPDDPRRWPLPPRSGTESDTRNYRDSAIGSFR